MVLESPTRDEVSTATANAGSERLAIDGGTPVRTREFPSWPIIDNSDREQVIAALESGVWGVNGKQKEAFEEKFAAYVGTRFAATVANGSVSLRLALIAAGIQSGEEVIIPPYTFIATAVGVLECNATPVFVDIEPDTYNINPDLIEAAVTSRTRAIMPVHLGGLPADMDRINAIAKKHNLVVIEDAAHAHGAEWIGRKVGSLGDMASFSFQSSKNLASGEGGAVTTDDENWIERLRALRSVGRLSTDAWYEHSIMGGNYRLGELHAALLVSQLERLEEQAARRNENGLYLNEQLAKIDGITPLRRGGGETRHAYHLYSFRYSPDGFNGWPRERFLKALNAEGIPATTGYYRPIYQQPYFQSGDFAPYRKPEIDYKKVSCPVSEQACREAIWFHQSMLLGERADMDDIVDAILKVQRAAQ